MYHHQIFHVHIGLVILTGIKFKRILINKMAATANVLKVCVRGTLWLRVPDYT